MKTKFYLSVFVLLLFAVLGGGSISGDEIGMFFIILLVAVVIGAIVAAITSAVKSRNKDKRLQMIKEDEENSTDFDRSVFIGDDRCKIYFDSTKKQVMIMRVMTEGINKEYVDGFEFPGKELAKYNTPQFTNPVFNIYDPVKRSLLSGTYNDLNIIYQVTSISEKDKNKDVSINNTIKPRFETLSTTRTSSTGSTTHKFYNILLDECHGVIAISESGKVKNVFNFINANSLPKKTGEKSTINTKEVGNYMFIMDDFFIPAVPDIISLFFHPGRLQGIRAFHKGKPVSCVDLLFQKPFDLVFIGQALHIEAKRVKPFFLKIVAYQADLGEILM